MEMLALLDRREMLALLDRRGESLKKKSRIVDSRGKLH